MQSNIDAKWLVKLLLYIFSLYKFTGFLYREVSGLFTFLLRIYYKVNGMGQTLSYDSWCFVEQVVQKTAATFAPRASVATKNPAVPGTVLYTVFEVQGYASMLLGGALSFNLIFPSNAPDIWRLMGMWSIWMFSKQDLFQ